MKKLVLFAATIVAISFASCGGSSNTATTTETDSIATETETVETVDTTATATDSTVVATDSVAAN